LVSFIQIVLQTYLPYVNLTYLRVIRGLRALRTLRSITLFRSLQIIVNALVNTIKTTVIDILVLLFLFMFLFSIIGYHFFGSDPNAPDANYRDLGSGFLTSFVFVTADGWTDRQRELDELGYTYNRIFVVLFILIGNFIFTNLFIAVICKNIDEAQSAEKKLQKQKRQMLKKYKKELFARKQKDEIVQLMAHQRKLQNSNLQEVLKSLAGQLHHDDLQQMTHLCGDLIWLETFMITLNYHENSMYRCQQIHFEIANTMAEILDRRMEGRIEK
jgi:cation channel sperm-associated protein 3